TTSAVRGEASLDNTDTGRYFIGEASELLAALRLWAQIQYRTDQVVSEILKFGDVVALNDIARQLQELGTPENRPPAGRSQRSRTGPRESSWPSLGTRYA